MEVVDFHNYVGVGIDRRENRKKGVVEFAPFMMQVPNLTIYASSDPMKAMQQLFKSAPNPNGPLSIEGMTLEITTKISANTILRLKSQ